MGGGTTTETIGVLIAFLTKGAMVYLDCYQALSGTDRYVPGAFFRSIKVLILAALAGAISAALYSITTPSGHDGVSARMGISLANPYVRALVVGIVSLTLIRSKFFKAAQTDIGGDYIYQQLRKRALLPIVVGWNTKKNAFIRENVQACLLRGTFIDDTLTLVRETVKTGAADKIVSGLSQVDQVEKDRPGTPFVATSPEWIAYYRTIMRLALDICGPSAFADREFKWPK